MPRKHRHDASSAPEITLEQALNSSFRYNGRAYRVASCPISILKQLASVKVKKGRGTEDVCELPALLDRDESDVARWYVVECLIAHKVLKRSYFQ